MQALFFAILQKRFTTQSANETEYFTSLDTVYDVSSVFKQYFRQLTTPIIPYELHETFLQYVIANRKFKMISPVFYVLT